MPHPPCRFSCWLDLQERLQALQGPGACVPCWLPLPVPPSWLLGGQRLLCWWGLQTARQHLQLLHLRAVCLTARLAACPPTAAGGTGPTLCVALLVVAPPAPAALLLLAAASVEAGLAGIPPKSPAA